MLGIPCFLCCVIGRCSVVAYLNTEHVICTLLQKSEIVKYDTVITIFDMIPNLGEALDNEEDNQ